jgi:hypothetical protein
MTFAIDETGVKHPDGLAVQRCELVAPEALVLPDGLEQTFGRGLALFVKERHGAAFETPLRIEAVRKRQHPAPLLRRGPRHVKPCF